MRLLAPLIGAALAGLLPSASWAREQRCGWIENPTPGNWSLVDRSGEWEIGTQGGYQAPGLDDVPDLTVRQWVRTNAGSYGYGCACLTVDTDKAAKRVTRLYALRQKPLSSCRADRTLPRP